MDNKKRIQELKRKNQITNLCKHFYKEYFTFITVFKYHLKN